MKKPDDIIALIADLIREKKKQLLEDKLLVKELEKQESYQDIEVIEKAKKRIEVNRQVVESLDTLLS